MSQPAHILVVDDEMPIRLTMAELLKRRGYQVVQAASGEEALEQIHQRPFDLLLLDLKMPGMDGIEVARRARERQPDAAIIILTGHGSLESAMDGIHLGVFDYMLKTSSPHEVIARVQAALLQRAEDKRRRELMQTLTSVVGELQGAAPATAEPNPADDWIAIGDLQISTWKQMARLGDKTLNLTPTEFRVLVCLAQQAGQVMTYQQIVHCAQGYDADVFEATELVKPHIYHLRQKIEPDPATPRYILTVRGTGYLLTVSPDEK
ncbi:MAG: response regulator transcription factor [Anaerolineae bacterium]|nr:response regulator transcription factor [Anaerolineae bacterium]